MKIRLALAAYCLCAGNIGVGAEAVNNQTNTVDYSIIRSVGAVCGAGLTLDAKGDVDAKISRIFGGGVEASGETRLDVGQVKDLLMQFSESDGKQTIYNTYVTCIIQAINAIVGVSKETDSAPVIDNLLIPDPLIIIKDGQRFAMRAGESRAIGRNSLIFTLDKIEERKGGPNALYFSYSDMERGKSIRQGTLNNTAIVFYEGCLVVPYQVDTRKGEEKVSFSVKCKP